MTIQTDLNAAVSTATAAAAILDAVANGPAAGAGSTVETESGPVKSAAKAVADAEAYIVSQVGGLGQAVSDAQAAQAAAAAAAAQIPAHEGSTSAHGVSGQLVGTTDTQTLTNKTIAATSVTRSNGRVPGLVLMARQDFGTLTQDPNATYQNLLPDASVKWKVVLPDGSLLDTSGTMTCGLQEAINYATRHGHDLKVEAGGMSPQNWSIGTALGANPLSVTTGSSVVTVTHPAHGIGNNTVALGGTLAGTLGMVTFSGAMAVGGIDAANINGPRIVTVVDANTYTFDAYVQASSTAAGGGISVTAAALQTQGKVLTNALSTVAIGTAEIRIAYPGHGLQSGDGIQIATGGASSAVGGISTLAYAGAYPSASRGTAAVTVIDANTLSVHATANATSVVSGGGGTIFVQLLALNTNSIVCAAPLYIPPMQTGKIDLGSAFLSFADNVTGSALTIDSAIMSQYWIGEVYCPSAKYALEIRPVNPLPYDHTYTGTSLGIWQANTLVAHSLGATATITGSAALRIDARGARVQGNTIHITEINSGKYGLDIEAGTSGHGGCYGNTLNCGNVYASVTAGLQIGHSSDTPTYLRGNTITANLDPLTGADGVNTWASGNTFVVNVGSWWGTAANGIKCEASGDNNTFLVGTVVGTASINDASTTKANTFLGGPAVGFPLGSAAAPSVSTNSDSDTGLYFPGADQVAASCGGAQMWIATPNGVGIGGTAATAYGSGYKSVKVTGSSGGAVFDLISNTTSGRVVADSGAAAMQVKTTTNHPVKLGTNNTDRVTVDASGNLYPTVDNAYTCGASSYRWSTVYAATGTINTSDEREKTDIANEALGLSFILGLRPVSYKWVIGGNDVSVVEDGFDEVEDAETGEIVQIRRTKTVVTPRPGSRIHHGLIAQEVKALADGLGIDFAGHVYDPDGDRHGLRYDQFVAPLVRAVQELAARLEACEALIPGANDA